MTKKCAIKNCQENTFSYYPLCKKHLEKTKNGEVYKNDNGTWIEKSETTIDTKTNKENKNCALCGEKINSSYVYCKDCYNKIMDRIDEIDKNQNPQKLKDYYYNAKDYAMRIFDEDKINYQKLTMIAITSVIYQLYNDYSLNERITKDIEKINENLNSRNNKLNSNIKETSKIDEIKAQNDKDKAKIKKTQDGHFVESEFEIKVDDILYTNNIVHAYAIKVDEIIERTVICDWYIPVTMDKGIFIELWGVKGDEKYNKNKKEKIELYKKHNITLIEIEYDELRDNTQRLKSSIISQIKKLKEEIKKNI